MKHLFLFCFFFLLCNNLANAQQTPTFADPPGPENVLVVYNMNSGVSDSVKEYYKTARGIPASNIVPLNLPDEWFTYNGTTHRIEIVQSGDILKDTTQAWADRKPYYAGPSFHAWQYFYEKIALPIKTHLANNNLEETIRYIVLCKGVPFRLQSRFDWSGQDSPPQHNVSLHSLLSILNNEPYYDLINSLYNNNSPNYRNPYYEAVQIQNSFLNMDYRFLPDFYTNPSGISLSYLVTRLDAVNYGIVEQMIQNSINADISGLKTWVLDAHTATITPSNYLNNLLVDLGFEVNYNNGSGYIFNNQLYNNNQVMGYSSGGRHAGLPPQYIQSQLNFDYAFGAVFNTFESFNGNSIGEVTRREGAEQGLLTEFLLKGGTGGVCYPWEPGGGNGNIVFGNIFFPAYALGYNLVDAIYMDMPKILFQNVVVGDPLTRIFNYQTETFTGNNTLQAGTYKHRIIVPEGSTLTIPSNAEVNFERNGQLIVNGELVLGDGAKLNLTSYSFTEVNNITIGNNAEISAEKYSRIKFRNNFYAGTNFKILFSGNAQGEFKNFSTGNGGQILLMDNSKLIINETYEVAANNSLILNANTQITGNTFKVLPNGSVTLNGTAIISFTNIIIKEGASVNLNAGAQFGCSNLLEITGNENSPVLFNGSVGKFLTFNGAGGAAVSYANFNNVGLSLFDESYQSAAVIYSVNNTNFTAATTALEISGNKESWAQFFVTNTTINGIEEIGIDIINQAKITISGCNITQGGENSTGIRIQNATKAFLENTTISNSRTGIIINPKEAISDLESSDLGFDFSANTILISDCEYGIISRNGSVSNFNINQLNIENCSGTGISISNGGNTPTLIKDFTISALHKGISVDNTAFISIAWGKIFTNYYGIVLNNVQNSYVNNNELTGSGVSVESGILLSSSVGDFRGNLISGFNYGIEAGNSAFSLGGNTLLNNNLNGLYLAPGAVANMSEDFILRENVYLRSNITGYNIFQDNGFEGYEPEESAEIFINGGLVYMSGGFNTIQDDRNQFLDTDKHKQLMFGENLKDVIKADGNYWGNHPLFGNNPAGRFWNDDQEIYYEPYLTEQPVMPKNLASSFYYLTFDGNVLDTIAMEPVSADILNTKAQLTASADGYFYQHDYDNARAAYIQLIEFYPDDLNYYGKLFQIERITKNSADDFLLLRQLFETKLNLIHDSFTYDFVDHLISLCYILETNYHYAINQFTEIMSNNSGSEEAFYAELDLLATQLLVENEGLEKSGKHTGIDIYQYHNRLGELLKNRKRNESLMITTIPLEFALFQNYPNPFNPVTNINFNLPEKNLVELAVYNVLGQKVATLTNEILEAGVYSIPFDATLLPSGVYIYNLRSGSFNKSAKMLLLK